ncbi:MAG TPA: alkaline phosphatase family protein [Candidatus Saccharimonadales bacterium]|nr:alkaline phosphatase family protein [Candidatus Saccharimonadales bacterium]
MGIGKNIVRSFTGPLLLSASLVISLAIPSVASAEPDKNRIVIVISLDGFPAYALDDPRLPIPTLRKLIEEGTVAASMKPVNPTVTWPNHTAMITGVDASKHHVVFNGLLTWPSAHVPPPIEPWRDKDVMVHAPTVYDIAHEAGLTTAQVDWVAIYHAKTIDWQFAELPDPNGEIEKGMIAKGLVTKEQLEKFEASSQAWQDQMWTNAAVEILEKHKPNLLLFHLLTLDDINHEYGPMSGASLTAMAFLDSQVKRILDVLKATGMTKRATVLIVSDHGFRTYQHKIHANVLLRQAGLLSGPKGQETAEAWVAAEGGSAMVYVANPARKAELIPRLRQLLTAAPGVDHVYGTEDFSRLGLPSPEQSNQAPDLVLAAKPDYAFDNELEGAPVTEAAGGTHGFLNSDPKMQAIFIAWGAGIPSGVHLNSIANFDVAPTIAALLGLELKQTQGHAIPLSVKPVSTP